MKKIGILCCLFVFSSVAVADIRWLKVEVIVFQHLYGNSTEYFSQSEAKISPVKRYARVNTTAKSLFYTYNRLKKSSAFKPFYHQSWKIPVKNGHISLPIEIDAPHVDLKGWIKIQRGYLLNVIAELEFSPQHTLIYHLKEKRRVLFNELHYLDHPKFGLIVKVSKL